MTGGTSSSRSSPTSEQRLAVGHVVGAKGLRGALKVEPLSDRPERLAPGGRVFLESEDEPREITSAARSGRLSVITLAGVSSREAAERLVGSYIEAEREPLPEGTYYWHELVGMTVHDEQGDSLGSIDEVFRAGENEVYRVRGPHGEILVPALREVVIELDVSRRRMTVRLESEELR